MSFKQKFRVESLAVELKIRVYSPLTKGEIFISGTVITGLLYYILNPKI